MVTQYKFRHHNPIATESYVFNTRRKPFNDIRFRQALTYAYDFEWQNKALFYGQYQRLQSYFENSDLAATGRPSNNELAILKPLLPKLSPIMQKLFWLIGNIQPQMPVVLTGKTYYLLDSC